jgi:chromosome segregation ATPase
MTGIEIENFKINLNTIIALVGFLSTFAFLITTWNDAKNNLEDTNRWIEQHNSLHDAIAKELAQLHNIDTTREAQVLDLTFRISQLEKEVELLDARMSRVVESSTNQFTEVRGSLSTLTTQLALANQSLQRLEVQKLQTSPNDLKKSNFSMPGSSPTPTPTPTSNTMRSFATR